MAETQMLSEMLTIVLPRSDGLVPIAMQGNTDPLKKIIDSLGFSYLTTN